MDTHQHPHQQPRPFATALHLLWPLALVAAVMLVLLAALAGTGVWLLKSEGGTRWLLARLPMVQASGVHGALLSERFDAERLRVSWAGGQKSVTITALHGEGLAWTWRPQPGAWVGLDAAQLSAAAVVFDSGPPSGQPLPLPATLQLPLRLTVASLQIAELQIDTLAPLQGVGGRIVLGVDGQHRVEALQLDWDRLHLQGRLQVAATAPFALSAALQLAPRDTTGPAFNATLQAGGTLSRVEASATVRGQARTEGGLQHAAPSADVAATLTPFAPWPLAALSAQTQALDLAVFASALPQTRLSGHVQVHSSARDAPIGASVQLDNTEPGRWDERRLPLRSLALELQASAQQRDRLELSSFDAVLGSGPKAGGRWQGHGQWLGHELQLQSTFSDVQPQYLDGRAPAMTLSGPLLFTLAGLPSPDAADKRDKGADVPPLRASLRTTLDGRLAAAPQPVRLTVDASADAHRIEIRQLRAAAGGALAQAKITAERKAGPPGQGGATGEAWQLASGGSLSNFDPQPWWPGVPGEPGAAWRRGPHRLTADWQLDLRLPAAAAQLAPLALLQSVAGTGNLKVHDSLLAGVPLALDLSLGQQPLQRAAPGSLRGELRLGGNRISIEGQGNPAGAGDGDRWRLDADAATLATLAPLFKLSPALAMWAPSAGSASASISAQGRWPLVHTEGQVQVQQLTAGELTLAGGKASWRLESGLQAQQPLELQAELTGMRLGTQRLEQAHADLHGTWRQHELVLTAALPLSPPPAAEQLLGLRTLAGTRVLLQAEGAWTPRSKGSEGGRWQGHVTRLAAGAWDGGALTGEAPHGWMDAHDLRADLQFGATGRLERLHAEPGRVLFADAVALRWDEIVVEMKGAAPNIDLKAEIDPFALAPLLARLQPGLGWGGDLRLAAKVQIHAAERFDADVVFERHDGDLTLRDDAGTQLLGLTDFRLALAAHEGQWIFTQAFAGRTIGQMAGAVSVKTTAQQRWPPADAPLDGVVEVNVASLGVWSGWVPPGWRLSGELRTSATVGGTFGAPEYTGQVRGSELGVRNLLQGVNIGQGTVSIQLKGVTAQIETFSFKAGDGTLSLSGGAEFGATPNARLKLVAERFRLLGRIDRQLSVSGSADMLLQRDAVKLDGRFKVDEGLFDTSRSNAPGLDDDVTVRRATDEPKPEDAAAAANRPRRNVAVTVDVDLGDKLRVKGRGLDTALRGQLRITTPGGRLAVNGTVSTEEGTYAAYGQKLAIDRGILAFSGPIDNPRLDILALRANTDTRVGVSITGNTLTPRVRLYSETDMSDSEKLSWLVLGRAPDGLGRTDTALLQRAAVALLAGEGEAPTDAVLKSLGIDELSLKQSDGEVRETVVSLGKQLSRRWYVGYERGVNATTGTWQLVYRIAQRFTLRAQSGLDNSLDIIWVWKFDAVPIPGMTKPKAAPP
jgi:translocation and assembly module TamB